MVTEEVYQANVNKDGDIAPVARNLNSYSNRRSLSTASLSGHQSGTTLETFYLAVVDVYGYIVKYGLTDPVDASAFSSSGERFSTTLKGTTSYTPTKGLVEVDNLVMTGRPDSTKTVYFSSDGLRDPSSSLALSVGLRACKAGEAFTRSGA